MARTGMRGLFHKLQSVYKICPILVSQIETVMPLRSVFSILLSLVVGSSIAQPLPFRNNTLPAAPRVNDLRARLTLEEKVGLLGYRSKSVDRLSIPAYNWWNEALHGVARA